MMREFSAGGVVFKKVGGQTLWLIIKPRPSPDFPSDRFQLPKGHVEADEKTTDAATREVFEETGIKAKAGEKIATSKYVFAMRGEKIFKIVTFYLMEYVSGETKENMEVEKVFWLPHLKAHEMLTYSSDKQILKRAAEMVESHN